MKKILFVVHRYPPAGAGGSEYNIKRLAEASVALGHDVTVLSDNHGGSQNGVKVTGQRDIAFQPWDLIVVHGSCPTQDFIHINAEAISKISSIYYMVVQPTTVPHIINSMEFVRWIGVATSFDYGPASYYGYDWKIRSFIYGINEREIFTDQTKCNEIRQQLQITTPYVFLATGGFWPHKKHVELANLFVTLKRDDVTLLCCGYNSEYPIPQASERVKPLYIPNPESSIYPLYAVSDLYILHSENEGYGLGIIESMAHGKEWIGRDIAAAHDLAQYGNTYTTDEQLLTLMENFIPDPTHQIRNKEYAARHTAINSALSVLKVLEEE